MNLTKATEGVKDIIRLLGVEPENVIFTKVTAGKEWIMITEDGTHYLGEVEELDYLSEKFLSDYIIVNDTGGGLYEFRFDVYEEDKEVLKDYYAAKGLLEDVKDILKDCSPLAKSIFVGLILKELV